MKLAPALPVLWYGFLVLWILHELKGLNSDACIFSSEDSMAEFDECEDISDNTEAVICVLYPGSKLNCSWSFPALQKEAQLSASVRVSENEELVDFRSQNSLEKVGFMSWTIPDGEERLVNINFIVTLHDTRICCNASFEEDLLNIMPPPPNVAASIQDGSLNVTWNRPSERFGLHCFDYQLDMGGKEELRSFSDKLEYIEPNPVPARTYRVRARTRVSDRCYGCTQWSDWSPTVIVEQPSFRLDPLVIAVISLGIPMILLAVLLLLRHQRLVKVLFPPIPHPPEKYKHFLEKHDPLSFFSPVPTAKSEEEITEVEDAEQDRGATK